MKFLQILDEQIEPGGLVEWTPFVSGGLGAWDHDPRLTSHNHEAHLRSAFEYRVRHRREGGRESWLGLSIKFDERLSIPAIRATLSAWIDRHEVLRSHVVIKGTGLQRLSTPPGSVNLKMSRIGWFNESRPLVEQIAGSFDRATAPLQWPAYVFATVGREHSFTLLFAADHSLVDGYSLIMASQELVTMYQANRRHVDPELPPVGSYVDFSAAERRDSEQTGADHPAVTTWGRFLASGRGDMPPFAEREAGPTEPSPPPGPTELGPPQESMYGMILDDNAANRFAAVCSGAGGTLTAGVLAALAVTYRERTGDPEFRCVLPRHTRDAAEWLGSLGWFVALAPFCMDISDSPTFDQAVARSTAELKSSRQGSSLPFLRIAELLGFEGAPRFVVSFIDTRFAPGAEANDAGRATVLRSHSYSDDEVAIWINRTPLGLRLSARFPRESPEVVVDPLAPTVGAIEPIRTPDDPVDLGHPHGPVQAFLHDFTRLVQGIGDASTFSATI